MIGRQVSTFDTNEFYREVTKAISSSLKIDFALHRLVVYLRTVMPADELFLGLYDSKGGANRIIASASNAGGEILDKVVPLSQEAVASIERILMSTAAPMAFIVHDLDTNPVGRVMTAALKRNARSTISKILAMEGERVATLVITTEGTGRFTQEHARLIDAVNDPLSIAVSNALHFQELVRIKDLLEDDNRLLQNEMHRLVGDEVVGAQFGLRGVMDLVRKVAPLDSAVLLLGETGSGKDVIGNAIHRLSARHRKPFIKVNCGAIPASLIDSELFGHKRGAFTGAIAQRRGFFERANHGTLFLDEIAELPMEVQARLLRVLQTSEFEVVGGSTPMRVDVRLIAATNRNLRQMIENGQFREDLWYRLSVFPIAIPSLRERLDDLPSLVHYFLKKKSGEHRLATIPSLARGALTQLLEYSWPGNVRELQNVIERALILSPEGPLDFGNLLPRKTEGDLESSMTLRKKVVAPMTLDDVEKQHIQSVLEQSEGRINGKGGAAELLAIHPNTLRHRMRKLGITFGRHAAASKSS
jgi:transcriptional regulator with GAF, ATPase, and Fis domain